MASSKLKDKVFEPTTQQRIMQELERSDNANYMNNFHAIAWDTRTNKLVEMVNVYTGECRQISIWRKIKMFIS